MDARKYKGELRLMPVTADARSRAFSIADAYVEIAKAHLGRTREELDDAIDRVVVEARDRRMAMGLRKLLDDRCTFEQGIEDAESLRRDVFVRAAARRRELADDARLDRDSLLEEIANERGSTSTATTSNLYGDLRDAHELREIAPITASMLVEAWELARPQAILLRATRVVVEVECKSAASIRAVLRRLKFLQLLHVATKTDRGHRLEIDGPFSIFEAQTKYGLRLAMLIPALRECDAFELEAHVRWGQERTPLVFTMKGGSHVASDRAEEPCFPDEIESLLASIRQHDPPYRVSMASAILELKGIGLCVPDLVFEDGRGRRVYLEVMGYWSRDAVFARIDLVEGGLTAPILFCVSERLRVSERLLDGASSAALYVYKGKMSARTIVERVGALMGAKEKRG